MTNQFKDMTTSKAWEITTGAARRALTEAGYSLKRLPGRGRSNVYEAKKDGKNQRVSVRTTRGRRFAFPSKNQGTE